MPLIVKRNRKYNYKTRGDPSIPDYLKEAYGPYIIRGYRGEITFYDAIKSVFSLHNETANIWSHLIAGQFFLMQMIFLKLDSFSFNFYQFCVTLLMFTSAIAHTLCAIDRKTYYKMWKYDFAAVALAMWSGYVVWCANIFSISISSCYLGSSGSVAATCIYLGVSDRFAHPKYRFLLPSAFCVLGGLGIIPIAHALTFYRSREVVFASVMTLMKFILSFTGALCHIYRIPERYFPGKLDYIGNGHNIMHLLIAIAFQVYFVGTMPLGALPYNQCSKCRL